MYALIWRALPGPWPVKAVFALAIIVGIVAVLFTWVFPEVAPHMPFNETTVGE